MSEPSSSPETGARDPDEVYCRDCGDIIDERAEICPHCGVRQRSPPRSTPSSALDDVLAGGNPFVAAVLSALLPGLGQIYNRELGKGLAIMVGSFLAAVSALVLVGFVLFPAIWLYAVYDAYRVAEAQATTTDTGEAGAGA